MPLPAPGGPTDPRAAADQDAAAQLVALAARLRAAPLPPAHLSGWSSLCAEEYARAMRGLQGVLLVAADALAAAGTPA